MKPAWLRRLHASGIHGCPAHGCKRCAEILRCIHPGVFATERPTEHCNYCNADIPYTQL